MVEYYSIVCGHHISFIDLSIDGRLDCICLLAIMNSAAMSGCFLRINSLDATGNKGICVRY